MTKGFTKNRGSYSFKGCKWLGGGMDTEKLFQEYRAAFFSACSFIANETGSCPHDKYDVDPFEKPCSEVCKPDQRRDECWGAYFLKAKS